MPDAPLWSAADALAATGGRAVGHADWAARGVEIDSRAVTPGDLFVALPGAKADGHDFVADALARGAAAALVSRAPEGLPTDAPLLLVDDPLAALGRLAAAARARARADLGAIAVTGSVGKTSTKAMLAAMLEGQGPTHAAVKSFNNHIGVPLTLARLPADTRFGVFEVGMNHRGEIAPLARLIRPAIGIVTSVAAVHLEALGSLEAIAEEKADLFLGLEPGGVAILDRGSAYFERMAARARAAGAGRVLEFGRGARDAEPVSVRIEGERTRLEARMLGRDVSVEIGAPGLHFASNALAALLSVAAAGADVDAAIGALAAWRAVEGRGARRRLAHPGGPILIVDESYNANPASVAAAIATFARAEPPAPSGRRVAFLTDMRELGPEGPALHAGLADASGIERVDVVHCAGPLMAHLHAALPPTRRGLLEVDAETLAARAPAMLEAGDAVMVKGSLGSRARLIVAALEAAFRPIGAREGEAG